MQSDATCTPQHCACSCQYTCCSCVQYASLNKLCVATYSFLLSGATNQLTSPCCAEIPLFPWDMGDETERLKELDDKIKASEKTPINYFTRAMPLYAAAGDTLVHGQ